MTPTETTDQTTLTITFCYMDLDIKGKRYYVWIDENDQIREYTPKTTSFVTQSQPGQTFTVPFDGKSISVGASVIKYKGMSKDERVIEWAAQHRANILKAQANKRIARDARADQLQPHLERLNKAYYGIPATQRAQLLAWMVAQITKYPESKKK